MSLTTWLLHRKEARARMRHEAEKTSLRQQIRGLGICPDHRVPLESNGYSDTDYCPLCLQEIRAKEKLEAEAHGALLQHRVATLFTKLGDLERRRV